MPKLTEKKDSINSLGLTANSSSLTSKKASNNPAKAICPTRKSSDRVPNEVWERILSHLYPSQLSRMSMVNKNLNAIV
ncbi:hypothetical protein BG015_001780, partial [Linnemannia schmuckeri]